MQAEVVGERRQLGPAREGVEHRVQVVQRVADLVDRQGLGLAQLPVLVEGLLFEEAVDAARRIEEGAVGGQARLVARGKHARLAGR
ncbi:MAG: hypothetical protein ACK56I_01890, partial [bacterium]